MSLRRYEINDSVVATELFWWLWKDVYIDIVILICCCVFRIFLFVCLDAWVQMMRERIIV